MALRINNLVLATAAVAASGSAFWFGTGLNPVWWLTWLATLPLLVVAPRLPGGLAFGAAVAAHLLGDLNTWQYTSILPLPVHLLLMLVPACILGLGTGCFRACLRRGALWQAWLSLPALWIAFEYLASLGSPHGTFGSLAYTQMDCLPLIQLASLAGISSVSFCPLLFSSTLAVLFAGSGSTKGKNAIGWTAVAFFTGVFGFGVWRLHSTPAAPTLAVGLVASDLPVNLGARSKQDSLALFQRYIEQVPALATQGASLVVMPEHLAAFTDESPDGNAVAVDALFSGAARRHGVHIVLGVDHVVSPQLMLNQARLYSPDGQIAAYDKHHLLPGMESPRFASGSTRTVVSQPSGVWGLAICKDMDFPALSRQYGNDGVGLLLVPAYDFRVDAWLHGRMAVLRGVESGFSIARSAKQGLLTLTDDRGRIIAERASDSAPFATLVAQIPIRHTATLYNRLGDWFAWFDLVLLALILSTGFRGMKPSSEAK